MKIVVHCSLLLGLLGAITHLVAAPAGDPAGFNNVLARSNDVTRSSDQAVTRSPDRVTVSTEGLQAESSTVATPKPRELEVPQPPPPPTLKQDSPPDQAAPRGLIPFVVERFHHRRNRYPGDEGKNHTVIKAAFREVVSDASRGAVQVLADDKVVALGTVVSSDGYILTKASELDGKIVCKLGDEKRYKARLIGVHDDTDLALLKIDANNLVPVRWSTQSAPAVGSLLATAGVANNALAIGVVSVGPRKIPAPSGVLGVAVGQADVGPRIDQVLDGTSAAKAGLRVNDIITRINDREVKTREALITTVGGFRPGDRVQLKVRRGDEVLDISTTLGSRMGNSRREFQNRLGGDLSLRRGGFSQAIQHDTVLRPRECGGPLVDLDGRVVGINIARAERVASYAIPTSVVQDVLDELMPASVARETSPRKSQANRVTAARPVR
jgi:serine protease Do